MRLIEGLAILVLDEVLLCELRDDDLLVVLGYFGQVLQLIRVYLDVGQLLENLQDTLGHAASASHCEDHGRELLGGA